MAEDDMGGKSVHKRISLRAFALKEQFEDNPDELYQYLATLEAAIFNLQDLSEYHHGAKF